ncbi:MAG: leucyl/phenylalanyl-tRNA--protein transferase [Actinomycetota bacterium]
MTAPWPVVDEDVARFSAPQSPVPSTEWDFSQVDFADDDLVAVGADLEPGTLVHAYSSGLFPMPIGRGRLGWFSPVSRGIIPLDGFHVSESLRKSARKFTVRFDTRFTEVMAACGDKKREHGWINDEFIEAYGELHRLGWAHSCEVYRDGELVGGTYGVRVGRFFAGESMFHRHTDASKVALWALTATMRAAGIVLFDVQWTTPHLMSLGAVDVARTDYLVLLSEASNH